MIPRSEAFPQDQAQRWLWGQPMVAIGVLAAAKIIAPSNAEERGTPGAGCGGELHVH
jgi:hypothetical protein